MPQENDVLETHRSCNPGSKKLLRSPYANAVIKDINADIAMKVPGIEAVFTYKDIDQNMKRFTCAGQTYPEPSPYDRLILDRHVRFIGDPVAIV